MVSSSEANAAAKIQIVLASLGDRFEFEYNDKHSYLQKTGLEVPSIQISNGLPGLVAG